jgi:hypothetical protein
MTKKKKTNEEKRKQQTFGAMIIRRIGPKESDIESKEFFCTTLMINHRYKKREEFI